VQYLLKMFVHDVDHPVAESPKGKEQDQEKEGEEDVLSVVRDEHTFFNGGLLRNILAVMSGGPAFVVAIHFLGRVGCLGA
jgi:hypothetical protein